MTVTAAQALPMQHVAASRPSIGRRSLPTAVLPPVHGPMSQRWRERPRCPALTAVPSPWRRGRSRHRWPCRVSLSVECVCPGRTRQPRAPDLSLVLPNNKHRNQRAHLSDMPPTSSGRMRSVRTHGPGAVTIAHVSLAPCSASSMLFAPLRPGTGPGLRALTTPVRGTFMGPCAMAGILVA